MLEHERNQINHDIKAALEKLDGSDMKAVQLLTGFTTEEIENLGGLPDK